MADTTLVPVSTFSTPHGPTGGDPMTSAQMRGFLQEQANRSEKIKDDLAAATASLAYVGRTFQYVGAAAFVNGAGFTLDYSALSLAAGDVLLVGVKRPTGQTVTPPAGEGWAQIGTDITQTDLFAWYAKAWGFGGNTDDTTSTWAASSASTFAHSIVLRGVAVSAGQPVIQNSTRTGNASSGNFSGAVSTGPHPIVLQSVIAVSSGAGPDLSPEDQTDYRNRLSDPLLVVNTGAPSACMMWWAASQSNAPIGATVGHFRSGLSVAQAGMALVMTPL